MPALRLPRTPVRPAGSKPKSSNRGVAAFAALVGCGFFSIPFLAHGLKKENFNSQEKPLNVSAVRRGAYQNSGSRDVGVDKDWDFATYTWHGRKGADIQRERALKEYERERQQRDGEKSTTN